ncbi:hypothetical protein C2G38_1042941 [Gigaspora rosea]|uniref:TLDc domain-containing protein n=1 Tax=Gigaspora rosea TaxID=44941 RepID=A0A397W4Q2_9GLOM|nr:hypothetical protein C2G38_1042941 [Gigaspora rosea]
MGTLDLTDQPGFNILALLVAVDELLLDQLINHIQEYFIDKESNWLKENFVMALPTISKLQSCKKIQDYIMKTIEPPINSESDIHDILAIANELALIHLIDRIQDLLIKNEPSWFKKDLIGFLCNFFNDKRYKKIQDYIMDTICIDPEPLLFELEGFPTLEKDIILEFIKRDDLAIEEIDVWKYLVKWTKAQYSSLSEEKFVNVDVNTWEDNELTSFKKYIEPFISYIRFCEMERDEFYYHITPYEKVLPENLYKNLIAYFLANLKPKNVILQPRNGLINIDSTIIKKKNARIIVGWIEGITAFTKKLFCEFSCIYRATYYGFDSEKFIKELSDSDYFLSKTSSSKVLLIKIKDSDLTIGGHISSLSRWSSSKNNFIFCLGSETSSNFHIPCSDVQYLDKSWVDFHFGNDYLKLFGRNGTCSILNDRNFIAEEIEIFRIDIPKF